jgi:hypothetical protein
MMRTRYFGQFYVQIALRVDPSCYLRLQLPSVSVWRQEYRPPALWRLQLKSNWNLHNAVSPECSGRSILVCKTGP